MKVRVERTIGDHVLAMETGLLAKQAAGSVLVSYGDTTVHLHDTLHGVRGGIVEAEWPVLARG